MIIGVSNTHNIKYYHENKRRDLGKEITGKRVKAFAIDQINPHDASGYRNIVIQVGINNSNNKLFVSIEIAFDDWLKKIIDIKHLYPCSNIIVAPILPTQIRALNDRAKAFNNMLFSCRIRNPFWQTLGFNSFLDDDDLLDSNFTRLFDNVVPDKLTCKDYISCKV